MTKSRSPRWLKVTLVAVLAIAGWLVGRSTRDTDVSAPQSASRPEQGPVHTATPALPSLSHDEVSETGETVESVASAQYHPRPADEWQGMLVDLSQRQYCEASSYCGFGLACLDDGACGPCQRDEQCASGEACVLDHCVPRDSVGCRSRSDCVADGEDALCVLSGLTGGEARGNSQMTSYCQAPRGGVEQDDSVIDERRAARLAEAAAQTPVEPPVSVADLRTRLDAELDASPAR